MMMDVEERWTPRLHLRRLTRADMPVMVSIRADPRTNAHRPGGPPSVADSTRTVEEFLHGWHEYGLGYWAVEQGRAIVGVSGVRPTVFRDRPCWNLYYRFTPAVWGAASPWKPPRRRC